MISSLRIFQSKHQRKFIFLVRQIVISNRFQILSSATWSSGSTFLTKLLTHYPGVFLSFEPLVMTNAQSSLDDQRGEEARHLVRDLFNCNYDEKSKGRQFLDFIGNKSNFCLKSYFHFFFIFYREWL